MAPLEIPSDPFFSDLRRLAGAARGEPEYCIFEERVRRYGDAMSILADLADARRMLDALARPEPTKASSAAADRDRHVTANALLSQAIILYARAAKSRSRHRTFVPLQRGMPPELRLIHDKVVQLRDDAIAHFGPGTGPGGRHWAKETVVLRIDGSVATLVLPYSRSTYQDDLAHQLGILVDHCTTKIWDICSDRADLLLKEGTRLLHFEADFGARLRAAEFDLKGFFNHDRASIQAFLNGRSSAGTIPPTIYAPVEYPTA
jgi:hypothetical protein